MKSFMAMLGLNRDSSEGHIRQQIEIYTHWHWSTYKGIESSVLTAGWHHIAAVWDGIEVKIHVDDVNDSQTAMENGTVIIITTTTNTKVGLDTISAAHYFKGLINEVCI